MVSQASSNPYLALLTPSFSKSFSSKVKQRQILLVAIYGISGVMVSFLKVKALMVKRQPFSSVVYILSCI